MDCVFRKQILAAREDGTRQIANRNTRPAGCLILRGGIFYHLKRAGTRFLGPAICKSVEQQKGHTREQWRKRKAILMRASEAHREF
jgi:hypothetical protein